MQTITRNKSAKLKLAAANARAALALSHTSGDSFSRAARLIAGVEMQDRECGPEVLDHLNRAACYCALAIHESPEKSLHMAQWLPPNSKFDRGALEAKAILLDLSERRLNPRMREGCVGALHHLRQAERIYDARYGT